MLCPGNGDKKYKHYKKLQNKHPGIDVTQAAADALFNETSEAEEIAKVKAAKEAEELRVMQEEEDAKKAKADAELKKAAAK